MIAESAKNSAASRATSKPLRRGRACMNCRFLKIKCDGVKPVCGPCRKHPKDDECEYADGPGRSRTKVLEDTVSRLEARLRELEHPEESTPSVALHDPYISYRMQALPSLSTPEARSIDSSSPFSAASSPSSLSSTQQQRSFGSLESHSDPVSSSGSSSSPHRQYTSSPLLGAEEPGFITIQSLLDKFLPHCQEFGFFLNIDKFRDATLRPLSFGHPSRPTPALLSAVYLWGVHLSQSQALLQQEQSFVFRALHHVVTDVFGSHPNVILHTLQAEILMSYYLLRIGRFIEAKSHTATAVSLALGAGLHKIRSVHPIAPSILGVYSDTAVSFHSSHGNIEESEQVNGFWAVVVLHKCITIALEPPTSICGTLEAPGTQVDTPWPLDIICYTQTLNPNIGGNNTIRNFLFGTESSGYYGISMTELEVKAAILFHKSAQFAGSISIMQPRALQSHMTAFQSIHRLVENFRNILLPYADIKHRLARTLLFTHALADAAVIKLHDHFSCIQSSSQQHCLEAARRIVSFGGYDILEVGLVNPFMGTLLAIACNVFIKAISRLRSSGNVWLANAEHLNAEWSEDELLKLLRSGITILSSRLVESAFTRYQLTQIQEALSAI